MIRISREMASSRQVARPALPGWIRNGELDSDELKAVVSSFTAKLTSKTAKEQIDGAEQLYALVRTVWSLETHLARDAADLVCDGLR